MFEDSLVESRIVSASASKRWTTLVSFSLQFAIAALAIALPLLHPEALPFRADTPKLLLPLSPRPPVRVQRAPAASTSFATPSTAQTTLMPPRLPGRSSPAIDIPALAPIGTGMEDGIPSGVAFGAAKAPSVTVAPARAVSGLLHISRGVSQGRLLGPIRPVYPPLAKSAHVEGTVIVEAIISCAGTIESLHVVSGPPMLQRAAIDAIQAARYQPYRLNGAPTAVETTITVNFRMGS